MIVVGQKCKNYIWELPCGSYLLEVPAVLLPSLCFPWSGKKEGWGTAAVWPIWVLSTSPCSPNIFEPSIFGIWVFFFTWILVFWRCFQVGLGNYWCVPWQLLKCEVISEVIRCWNSPGVPSLGDWGFQQDQGPWEGPSLPREEQHPTRCLLLSHTGHLDIPGDGGLPPPQIKTILWLYTNLVQSTRALLGYHLSLNCGYFSIYPGSCFLCGCQNL